ncbi:hypothetical protein [Methanosphaera cuniculi]|uniref:Uncharacterized protein n=1 Tax=Methanosphaera cuniculi TaxID=1077256 RepID=A0A2A2HF95_9EURY|nr:hypothetical protein [Methanosphaera cuniculi]PAV08102.1 hypothetical protein ASJ82_01155 [Methanosphaera cuniculi]PWL07738.1 hypothetical protein MSCUN_12690 [Methanosphaera cuniculi]
MENIVEDVLFYLPDWSIHSKTGNKNIDYIEPFLSDEDLGEVKVAKRVTPREVEVVFKRAYNLLLSYCCVGKLSLTYPLVYQACCTYAAGLLYNKYTLTDRTNGDELIHEAKELIQPFVKVRYTSLLHRPHHHHLTPRKHMLHGVVYCKRHDVEIETFTKKIQE